MSRQRRSAKTEEPSLRLGVFIATVLSPVLGDEPAGAGAVASAWAAVKSAGLSASALAVLQGLTMQFGFVVG